MRHDSKRKRHIKLAQALKNDRSSYDPHWRELGEYYRPRRTRFQTSDRNKGDKRSQKIIDSTPVFSAQTCAAGMMSGLTSPARPWHRLTVPDKQLAELESVRWWCEEVRERQSAILLRSNWYNVLPAFYSDLAVFGTAVMLMDEDDDTVVRFTHFPTGSYWLATNSKGQVRVFYREFDMTVRQVVEEFGQWQGDTLLSKNLSKSVLNAWREGNTEQPVTVCHLIAENQDYDGRKLLAKYKPFASTYWESGTDEDTMLLESGYDEWPVLAARWETSQGDVYGTDCPGMTALSDNKALQKGEKLLIQAIEKAVNPPMIATTSMRNNPLSILPGGVTYVQPNEAQHGFRPAIDTSQVRLDWLGAEQMKVRGRIERTFYVDLFRMVSSMEDRSGRTATEIMERKEEKLLSLGPVLERMNEDVLDPTIDRLFAIMFRRGELPEPPDVLDGVALRVEYVSIMAQAQKAVGRSGIEVLAGYVKALAEIDPTVLDKFDADESIDRFADAAGTPPSLVRDDERVAEMRQARAQQMAAQQAAEQTALAAQSAAALASADTGSKNALTDLIGAGQNTLGTPSPVGGL